LAKSFVKKIFSNALYNPLVKAIFFCLMALWAFPRFLKRCQATIYHTVITFVPYQIPGKTLNKVKGKSVPFQARGAQRGAGS